MTDEETGAPVSHWGADVLASAGIGLCAVVGFLSAAVFDDFAAFRAELLTGEAHLLRGAIAFVVTAVGALLVVRTGRRVLRAAGENAKEFGQFALMLLGFASFVGLAVILGGIFDVDPFQDLTPSLAGAALGLLVMVPMLAMLWYISFGRGRSVEAFRGRQIRHFSENLIRLTPLRILLMSLGAGIGEELLFRGALQNILAGYFPLWAAVLIQGVIFGLAHAANLIYVALTLIIGLYLGTVYALTGDLFAVIVAHAVYDVIALALTARLIARASRADEDNFARA